MPKPITGLGPGFSPWLPLKTEFNNDTKTWISKFPTDEEVTVWGVRKFIHWEVSIDILQSFALGALGMVIGAFASESMSTDEIPGVFEYKILKPGGGSDVLPASLGGSVVMWSKIHLSILNLFLTESVIGLANLGFYQWQMVDDRTFVNRSRRIPVAVNNSNPTLDAPVVIVERDNIGTGVGDLDTGNVLVRYNGTPLVNNARVDYIIVERAVVDPNELDTHDYPELTFERLPTNLIEVSPNVWEAKYAHPLGSVCAYRVGVADSRSDSISVACFGKSAFRTRIETFVIDGKPTLIYPSLEIPSNTRISQDDYANLIYFPKGREETFILDPPQGLDYTDYGGIIETWWNSPVYQFTIPAGCELHLKRDYFARFSQLVAKGKKEWQFSYKAGSPEEMWSVIRQVSGSILQAEAEGTEVIVFSGDYPIRQPAMTNRALVMFSDGKGAFLYAAKDGSIYCGLIKSEYTYLFKSNNGGRNFNPVYDDHTTTPPRTPITADELKKELPAERTAREEKDRLLQENKAVKLFNGSIGFRVVDMYQNNTGDLRVLAEGFNKDYLYIQINPQITCGYDNVYFIGLKEPGNIYKFVNYTDAKSDKKIVVAGSTHSFESTDGGKTWGYQEDDNENLDKYFDDQYKSIIDGTKNNTDTQVILAESTDYLYVEIRNGTNTREVFVGPKKKDNTYRLETYASPASDATLAIYGKTHRYVSSNGGDNWLEQQVVEE